MQLVVRIPGKKSGGQSARCIHVFPLIKAGADVYRQITTDKAFLSSRKY